VREPGSGYSRSQVTYGSMRKVRERSACGGIIQQVQRRSPTPNRSTELAETWGRKNTDSGRRERVLSTPVSLIIQLQLGSTRLISSPNLPSPLVAGEIQPCPSFFQSRNPISAHPITSATPLPPYRGSRGKQGSAPKNGMWTADPVQAHVSSTTWSRRGFA
jgi:hypothetical protein